MVRAIETVDADWFEAGAGIIEPSGPSPDEDEWEVVGQPTDEPPDLSEAELAVLDHEAERYETERLKLMDVLREPTHELNYYEKLTVTFVHKWKHGGEKEGWWRRARLVARQYKWASEMGDEETFSPASIAPLSRHLLLLAQQWNTPIWICDVKDAYLNVEQPPDEPVVVLIGDHYFELGRVLPGQRRGAQVWWRQLQGDLSECNMEGLPEVPTLLRSLEGRQATQVHVDDMMMTGDEEPTNKVVSTLKDKYETKVQGPFGSPGDEWNFLNRRYTIEEDFSITVRPDAKFYVDINEMLGQPRARSTPGPGGGDSLFNVDTTKPLDSADSRLFRTMVGKLLYLSNERPDAQVVTQYLASKSSCPTEQSMKVLKHLAGYLYATRGYGVNVKNRAGVSILRGSHINHDPVCNALVEAVSDSNFANDRETRRSLSSGQVYLNSALVYSFVRNQKVVTLSSGEAELVALTQTVSEAVLIKKAWAFIFDGPVDMIARTDSSVARAIAQRAGVGRVRHLQTSCLWIQMWTASKELKVLAIPTETNPADAGTKVLTGARLKKLCGLMGMVDGNGNLIKDDTNHKAKAGNAIKVLMMVQALLATTQLEGCDNGGPDDLNYILDYLFESFYVFGYVLTMVGGGYLYVLAGIIVMILSVYLVFGARWRVTFVLENRPYTSGLGPGYADGGSTSEGASSSASRGDAENDNTDEDQIFEDTFDNSASSSTPLATASSRTPLATASSRTPLATASSRTPLATASSRTPLATASSSTPLDAASSNAPLDTTSSRTPLAVSSRTPLAASSRTPLATSSRTPSATASSRTPSATASSSSTSLAKAPAASTSLTSTTSPTTQAPQTTVRTGQRALTEAELDTEVWLAGARGYAFHKLPWLSEDFSVAEHARRFGCWKGPMPMLLLRRLQGLVWVLTELYYDRCLLLLGALRAAQELSFNYEPYRV